MSRLPPLNALKAFEAAARHGGFIGASDELHVTRGAISRHVKLLEAHLGVPLFLRQSQGVRLTEAGKRLQETLAEAFAMIGRETDRITTGAADLRIICPPATSIRWLLPRLSAFRSLHPDIRLRLTTDFHSDMGYDPAEYDIGFSVEHWPNRAGDIEVRPLFPVLLTPACSPGYLAEHPLDSPDDMATCELLHETPRRADWTAWQNAFAPRGIDRAMAQDFPNLDMAVKAAVMGAGFVMADLVLCREELEAGALVAPFADRICVSPFGGVCLIGQRDGWKTPKVDAFQSWAQAAAKKDRADLEARLGPLAADGSGLRLR